MTNAIIASYHVSDCHERCPKTNDIWCQFQKDKIDGTDYTKINMVYPSIFVRRYYQFIMPSQNLKLKKCLRGKTQNANESSNGMIWNRIPKATHAGINNLSLGVYDAIAYFNYGRKATLDVFKMLNIETGIYTMQICDNLNRERKRND